MSALIAILVCVLLAALSCSEQLPDEKFFSAARSGDEKVLLEYLQKGVSAHSRDGKGNTAIIIASGRGQVNIIQILLEYEADPEDVTLTGLFEGKTTLSWAASQGTLQ
jgi:ankyrin repeat protein